ncbi:hypothetical protein K402DRAFT_420149 [Aulographum hederae CBS 113979]|uniref:Uncharacterized protein n=1 Tax=Aulographum hederae CBS 113979 TaxID=1176131 RepID=A0A6G1H410_9PEZI|nr:hypothetical protein K402DRAFT_420149 [Aulographum hederae CBS 113979]
MSPRSRLAHNKPSPTPKSKPHPVTSPVPNPSVSKTRLRVRQTQSQTQIQTPQSSTSPHPEQKSHPYLWWSFPSRDVLPSPSRVLLVVLAVVLVVNAVLFPLYCTRCLRETWEREVEEAGVGPNLLHQIETAAHKWELCTRQNILPRSEKQLWSETEGSVEWFCDRMVERLRDCITKTTLPLTLSLTPIPTTPQNTNTHNPLCHPSTLPLHLQLSSHLLYLSHLIHKTWTTWTNPCSIRLGNLTGYDPLYHPILHRVSDLELLVRKAAAYDCPSASTQWSVLSILLSPVRLFGSIAARTAATAFCTTKEVAGFWARLLPVLSEWAGVEFRYYVLGRARPVAARTWAEEAKKASEREMRGVFANSEVRGEWIRGQMFEGGEE